VRVRHRVAVALFLAVLSVGAPMLGGPVSAVPRDRLSVDIWVLDFDPLINGVPLTESRSWGDPASLNAAYQADVAKASSDIVDLRIARFTTIRDYPVKASGFRFTNEEYLSCLLAPPTDRCKELIDYGAVLNEGHDPRLGTPCEALRRGRVDEIWLWGGPWFGYLEYRVVSPASLCPDVDRTFAVMGFSYERGEAEMLHDLGHRAEALVQAGIGLTLWDRFDGQRARYGQDFACPDQPDATHPEVPAGVTHVGNVHFPPNAYCHYQYDRQHPVASDADDWLNFPALTGQTSTIDASTWGATQRGYMIWWLGHLPRHRGTANGINTDWWTYVFPAHRGRS
jgi:hypothetical protein